MSARPRSGSALLYSPGGLSLACPFRCLAGAMFPCDFSFLDCSPSSLLEGPLYAQVLCFNLETLKRCSAIESPLRLRLRTISFSSCQSLKVSSFASQRLPGTTLRASTGPCLRTVFNEACTLGHMWGMNHPLHYAVLASNLQPDRCAFSSLAIILGKSYSQATRGPGKQAHISGPGEEVMFLQSHDTHSYNNASRNKCPVRILDVIPTKHSSTKSILGALLQHLLARNCMVGIQLYAPQATCNR